MTARPSPNQATAYPETKEARIEKAPSHVTRATTPEAEIPSCRASTTLTGPRIDAPAAYTSDGRYTGRHSGFKAMITEPTRPVWTIAQAESVVHTLHFPLVGPGLDLLAFSAPGPVDLLANRADQWISSITSAPIRSLPSTVSPWACTP